MCDQRTAAREGPTGAGTGRWYQGRSNGTCKECGHNARGREYSRTGLCYYCLRRRRRKRPGAVPDDLDTIQPEYRVCEMCRIIVLAEDNTTWLCTSCRQRHYRPIGPRVRDRDKELSALVGPTRKERIRYYRKRAAGKLPLFSEGKYGRPDLR